MSDVEETISTYLLGITVGQLQLLKEPTISGDFLGTPYLIRKTYFKDIIISINGYEFILRNNLDDRDEAISNGEFIVGINTKKEIFMGKL